MGLRTKLLPAITAWQNRYHKIHHLNYSQRDCGCTRICRGEYMHSGMCRVRNVCSKFGPIQKPGVEQLCASAVQHLSIIAPARIDIIAYTIQHGFGGNLE